MGEGGGDAAALPRHISPSVTAKGRDTSLAEGGKDGGYGFPRQCEHWLGMTPLRGVGAMHPKGTCFAAWASPPTKGQEVRW